MLKYLTLPLALALISQPLAAQTGQECLGRWHFTVPNISQFEWATSNQSVPLRNSASFGYELSTFHDEWRYNRNILLTVSQVTDKAKVFERQTFAFEVPITLERQRLEKDIETNKRRIEGYIRLKKENEELKSRRKKIPEHKIITDKDIQEVKDELKVREAQLAALEQRKITKQPLEVPDAYAIGGPKKWAFLWRNSRTYLFYFSNLGRQAEGLNDTPITLDEVNQTLVAFSPRQLGEVPNEVGYCFPYGYIGDDGNKDYEIKNSFRFTDQPNTLYSIYTGTTRVNDRYTVDTIGFNNDPRLPQYDPAKFALTQLDNLTVPFGQQTITLKGWQISEINPQDPNNPINVYLAWGKLRATAQGQAQPYVGFQIIAYPATKENGLTTNAPSIETAIKRVSPLLKSMQLKL